MACLHGQMTHTAACTPGSMIPCFRTCCVLPHWSRQPLSQDQAFDQAGRGHPACCAEVGGNLLPQAGLQMRVLMGGELLECPPTSTQSNKSGILVVCSLSCSTELIHLRCVCSPGSRCDGQAGQKVQALGSVQVPRLGRLPV